MPETKAAAENAAALARLTEVTTEGFRAQSSERASIASELASLKADLAAVKKDEHDIKEDIRHIYEVINGNGKPGMTERMAVAELEIATLKRWNWFLLTGFITSLLTALGTIILTFFLHAK